MLGVFLVVNAVVLIVQAVAYKMTETEEQDYDDALKAAYTSEDEEQNTQGSAKNFSQHAVGSSKLWPQHLFLVCLCDTG